MNRERFIRDRRDDWQHFERLLVKMKDSRQSKWLSRDVSNLSRLYRSICYDLSLVQSREWGARLELYLNDLVAQGHNCLYRSPPQSIAGIWDFFAVGFPRLLRQRTGAFLLALALFLLPLLSSVWVGATRPDLAELVAGKEQIDGALASYRTRLYTDADMQYSSERSRMFGFYINNNTGIAFKAFSMGVLAGIGTCYVLISNGISIGIVMGAIFAEGNPTAENFFSFVISHGAFELTAIVIAGAGGLVLAQGILMPGQRTRGDSIRHHGSDALRLALGAGGMLFVAALLEGYFSPLPTISPTFKYIVGTGLWILVAVYLTMSGREKPVHAS
jgi:uncharacterized membrane protein SpoIIM required for sporulation